MQIYKGDNGVILRFTITDDGNIVDLTGATVETVIKTKNKRIVKASNINNAPSGKVDVTLISSDLSEVGRHNVQLVVRFPNGNKYSSDTHTFHVSNPL